MSNWFIIMNHRGKENDSGSRGRHRDDDDRYERGSGSSVRKSKSRPRGKTWDNYVPKAEEPCPPPPIVDGYAVKGYESMPSTGIDYEGNQYECYVCDVQVPREFQLNIHLEGKPHIRKLQIAGYNSFLPPKPLGPIPGIRALKDEKWITGEKRTYSEIDPTNKGQFYCADCDLMFEVRVMYENHIKGKPHARRLKWKSDVRQNEGKADCALCQFIATSAVHLESHLQGKQHKKRVEAAKKGVSGGIPSVRP